MKKIYSKFNTTDTWNRGRVMCLNDKLAFHNYGDIYSRINIKTKEVGPVVQHSSIDWNFCVKEIPNNKLVFGHKYTLMVLDTNTLQILNKITEHVRNLLCIEYHDGYIYTGSTDWQIRKWRAEPLEHLGHFKYTSSN